MSKRLYKLRKREALTGFAAGSAPYVSRHEQAVHVRNYTPSNWWSACGVRKKRREIERLGIPSMHKWRFTTLTCCRERFVHDPLNAYLAGKARMRAFLEQLKVHCIIARACRWAWKLEFHQDGFPHWHLVMDRRKKLSHSEMAAISKAWGLGRVNTQVISEAAGAFAYTFKYAFKPVLVVDESEAPLAPGDPLVPSLCVPQWFADYCATKSVVVKTVLDGVEVSETVQKPVTFARMRFWQTSKGFYTNAKAVLPAKKTPQKTWSVPYTVASLIARARVQVVCRSISGQYRFSLTVPVKGTLENFWNRIAFDSLQGGSVGLAIGSYVVPIQLLKRLITICSTRLIDCYAQNMMTLKRAACLRSQGEPLLTC